MSGVSIIIDEATPLLERVASAAQAKGLALVGARAGANLVRKHLFALNSVRHRYGRNYYAQAARSVHTAADPRGAVINISHVGMRQRRFGGTIRAKPGSALTIPEDEEAMGKRAREFNALRLAKFINPRTGELQAALVRNLSTPISIRRRKQKDGSFKTSIKPGEARGGEIMYWLVQSVTQRPDPSVLPTDAEITTAVLGGIATRMARLTKPAKESES